MRRDVRRRVAREAASLLYYGLCEDYKTAKQMAAETLGVKFLPSNLEVALELDRLADEVEGPERRERLVSMRREALRIMELLRDLYPRLIGSVWRGTARRDSDIDIAVYSDDPGEVRRRLEQAGYRVVDYKVVRADKGDRVVETHHIYLETEIGNMAEVVVRPMSELHKKPDRCEVYGDLMTGLGVEELRKVLETDPYKKFIPG